MLFAYFGPETFLPLTSVIAGVAGVFLMFGKNSVRMIKLAVGNVLASVGLKREPAAASPPPAHIGGSSALDRRRARVHSTTNAEEQAAHGE